MQALFDAVSRTVFAVMTAVCGSVRMVIWMVCGRVHPWCALKVFAFFELEGVRCAQIFLNDYFVRAGRTQPSVLVLGGEFFDRISICSFAHKVGASR